LGQRGDFQAIGALTAMLRDADDNVRGIVSRSLQRLGWKPGDDSERLQQILAQGNLRQLVAMGPKAIPPLVELLRNGTPEKQFAAVKALGEINDPRVSQAMLEVLKRDDPLLRTAALGVLERMGDPSVYDAIERLLRDGNATVRGAAIEAAARCGGKRAGAAAIRALRDSSWEVRHIAVKTLGALGDPAAVDGLCGMLYDADRDVRESTILSLGNIGDRRAIPVLVPLLYDEESVIRTAAGVALRRIDRKWEKDECIPNLLAPMKAALDHHDYWVKHSALKLFEQLEIDPETVVAEPEQGAMPEPVAEHPAFSILADLLFDFDRDVRLAAAEAFGRLREKGAQPILAAAVHDEDRQVQRAALDALVAIA
jgi:HEAT repeat protein